MEESCQISGQPHYSQGKRHWNLSDRRLGRSQRVSGSSEWGKCFYPWLESNNEPPFGEPSHCTYMDKVKMCWICIFHSNLHFCSGAVSSSDHTASDASMGNVEGRGSRVIRVSLRDFTREPSKPQSRESVSKPSSLLGTSQRRSWSEDHITTKFVLYFNSYVRKDKYRLFYAETKGTNTPQHMSFKVTHFRSYAIFKKLKKSQ